MALIASVFWGVDFADYVLCVCVCILSVHVRELVNNAADRGAC